VFIGVIAVGLAVAWIVGNSGGDTARSGSPAPQFTVELIDGGSFDLSTHLVEDGRPLIVNLWASWCPPCRTEIPALSTFATSHPELAILGVAVEEPKDDSADFAGEMQPSYPMAWGDSGFRDSYPNVGLPTTFFIDGEGTVTNIFRGTLTFDTLEDLTSG
jgi:thiol-disulfide isomerase/thioredoxin